MDFSKYPRTKAFLEKHPEMTFDEAYEYIEALYREGQD